MSAIEVRIFLGYLQNGEMKMHLSQSALWSESKWQEKKDLMEAYWEKKAYIGFFITNALSCEELKKKEEEIKTQLQLYCPKLNLDGHISYLFPQTFLS